MELPLDIMFNIFSRIPVKSLARFKCVSKQLCKLVDDPHLAIIHTEEEPIPFQMCVDFKTIGPRDSKTDLIFESHSNGPYCKFFSLPYVLGSCYGLFLLQMINHVPPYPISFIVTHPLRKEKYELPRFINSSPRRPTRISHGLGFDHSTNTFKIVKVLLMTKLPIKDLDLVRQNSRTMVHVLGTRSWREIPNVPSYPLGGSEAIFAHGFLYWFTICIDEQVGERKVSWFDMAKEEFGSIDPPKIRHSNCVTRAFNLNGDLGVSYNYCGVDKLIEVWVMKEKVWRIHCQIDRKPPVPRGLTFIGIWNKDGDILVESCESRFFVFGVTTGAVQQINIQDVEGYTTVIRMFTPSLFSINVFLSNKLTYAAKELHRRKKKIKSQGEEEIEKPRRESNHRRRKKIKSQKRKNINRENPNRRGKRNRENLKEEEKRRG